MNYDATIEWTRGDQAYVDNKYSRAHVWRFDGGAVVPGSSAPASVPLPYSDASAVDPEEAMVASLSSCHMLWFLSLAGKHKFCVDRYFDAAIGVMASKLHRPNHLHTIFKGFAGPLPQLDTYYRRMVHIPCGWWLGAEDRERIVDALKKG